MRENRSDLRAVTEELAGGIRTRLPESIASVLEGLTSSAVEHVPGADHAGITVITKRNKITSTAATSRAARRLDHLQSELGEGPCVDAATHQHTIRVDDLAVEKRWPAFSSAALAATPIRSALSFRLYSDREATGALNLYGDNAFAFTEGAEEVGLMHAAHAAVALYAVRRHDEFESALASRDIIGQAKGMIMERYDLDGVQAFDLLKKLSQESNTRLVDVSRRLVRREHPAVDPPRTPRAEHR
ncbi:GAF and ANTAR domain-containing protein [Williamsia muralis]|uniref:GAF and ANTAR domain-containing protein n=1 Tax=Williamsia marianensis TaxID=85044 RepID=UPI000DE64589|nr:GAF and ANTAR domain-containing protein [Williamsia marianensis]PVY30841.1 GAF domain-containing protein [Williamsia marianensis]